MEFKAKYFNRKQFKDRDLKHNFYFHIWIYSSINGRKRAFQINVFGFILGVNWYKLKFYKKVSYN